jgi:hypothetical protein
MDYGTTGTLPRCFSIIEYVLTLVAKANVITPPTELFTTNAFKHLDRFRFRSQYSQKAVISRTTVDTDGHQLSNCQGITAAHPFPAQPKFELRSNMFYHDD